MEQEKNEWEGGAIPKEKIRERRVWVEQHKKKFFFMIFYAFL
jgi:hypothetical protein